MTEYSQYEEGQVAMQEEIILPNLNIVDDDGEGDEDDGVQNTDLLN